MGCSVGRWVALKCELRGGEAIYGKESRKHQGCGGPCQRQWSSSGQAVDVANPIKLSPDRADNILAESPSGSSSCIHRARPPPPHPAAVGALLPTEWVATVWSAVNWHFAQINRRSKSKSHANASALCPCHPELCLIYPLWPLASRGFNSNLVKLLFNFNRSSISPQLTPWNKARIGRRALRGFRREFSSPSGFYYFNI